MTIYKYPLNIVDTQILELPYPCNIISVINQRDRLILYAMVDTESEKKVKIEISIRGTGHDIQYNPYHGKTFLATVDMNPLVWHIFYKYSGLVGGE